MPLDAKLDCCYFMKNRERLLKFIQLLKDNPDVTDQNISSRSIQEKIARQGLGLRDTYAVSAMACLLTFVASFGGVDYFRNTPLEIVAGHRAFAFYILHYVQNGSDLPGNCPYYKCSLVAAERLYKKIFQLEGSKMIPSKIIRALQHILQSKNYCNDYLELKEQPFDQRWNKEEFLTRLKKFIQQQILFDDEKDTKVKSKTKMVTGVRQDQSLAQDRFRVKDVEVQCDMQRENSSLGQLQSTVDRISLPTTKEMGCSLASIDDETKQEDQFAEPYPLSQNEDSLESTPGCSREKIGKTRGQHLKDGHSVLDRNRDANKQISTPAPGIKKKENSPVKRLALDLARKKRKESSCQDEQDFPIQKQLRTSLRKRKAPEKLNL